MPEKANVTQVVAAIPPIDVRGRVVDSSGAPVAGASVQVKGNKAKGTSTDANGYFELKDVAEDAVLVISAVNIEEYEAKIGGRNELAVLVVKPKVSSMSEVM